MMLSTMMWVLSSFSSRCYIVMTAQVVATNVGASADVGASSGQVRFFSCAHVHTSVGVSSCVDNNVFHRWLSSTRDLQLDQWDKVLPSDMSRYDPSLHKVDMRSNMEVVQ